MNIPRLQALSTAIMPQVCRPRLLKTSNCTSARPWTATVALAVASAELMPAERGDKPSLAGGSKQCATMNDPSGLLEMEVHERAVASVQCGLSLR